MAQSTILKKRKYSFEVSVSITGGSRTISFKCENLDEIKKLLKIGTFYDNSCMLFLDKVIYDSSTRELSYDSTEEVSNLLENITVDYYELRVRGSSSNYDTYIFDSLSEVKLFFAKYRTDRGTKPTYQIWKYHKYFDKDASYKITTTSQLINEL